jgi:hypothetical protein
MTTKTACVLGGSDTQPSPIRAILERSWGPNEHDRALAGLARVYSLPQWACQCVCGSGLLHLGQAARLSRPLWRI